MKSRAFFVYIGLTYILSWSMMAYFRSAGGTMVNPSSMKLILLYMWMPALAAVITTRFVLNRPLKTVLGLHLRFNMWYIWAVFIPVFLAFGSGMTGIAFMPGQEFSPDMAGYFEKLSFTHPANEIESIRLRLLDLPVHYVWVTLAKGLMGGIFINAVAAIGGEIGWRGFMQWEFAGKSFWLSSLMIGFIWGLWHLPVTLMGFNYPQNPEKGILLIILFTMLISPIMCFLRLKAGTIFISAVFIGVIYGLLNIPFLFSSGGSDLTMGITGTAGLITIAVADIALYLYSRFYARRPLRIADPFSSDNRW